MIHQVPHAKVKEFHWSWLYKVSGAAALLAGALLLVAAIDLMMAGLKPGANNGWLSLFQDNWLVLIFKMHAGLGEVEANLLHVPNLLDIAILALVGTMCLGLHAALKGTSKIWSLVALALPFIGIILFTTTKLSGRSSVMGAGLIISLVMLRNNTFNKVTAYMGILANVLLLGGDFSVGIPHSNLISTLFGIGYVLLTVWFFLLGRRLLQLGR